MDLSLHRKTVPSILVVLLLASSFLIVSTSHVQAQTENQKEINLKVGFKKIISVPGDRIWDVKVLGDLIFTASGKSNVVIYSYDTNGNLFRLNDSTGVYLAPSVYGIDVKSIRVESTFFDGIVYAAAGPDGILIMEVKIDLAFRSIIWTLLSHISISSGSAYDVYYDAKNDRLYATMGSTPAAVYDVSNPSSPVELSVFSIEGIFQAERLAPYITQNGDVHIIVAAGPAGLLRLYYSTASQSLVKSAQGEEGSGFYMDVIVFDLSIIASNGEKGFIILEKTEDTNYDIPKSPTGEVPVDGYSRSLTKINSTHFYSANVYGGFEMYEIVNNDINHPVEVGKYQGINASIVVDIHHQVFVGDWNGGFQILDVTKYTETQTTTGIFTLDYNFYSLLVSLMSLFIIAPILRRKKQ